MSEDAKRVRSPNYPTISLKGAIEALPTLWSRMHTHPASREVVLKGLGYSSYNGASASALSAFLKYGLLERAGVDFKLSQRAIDILHPTSDAEREAALRAAALAPPLFAEIMETYGGTLPPSDDIIRTNLIRRGFGMSALPAVIQSLRETISLVPDSSSRYDSDRSVESQEEPVRADPVQPTMAHQTLHAPPPPPPPVQMGEGEREFAHGPLSKGTSYRLIVKGDLGPKELSKLIRTLELQKEILEEEDGTEDE